MSQQSSVQDFDALWLAESIRLTEELSGPLEDAEANRRARSGPADLRQRILLRAHTLGQRDGLLQAQKHWRQGAFLAMLLFSGLALISGAGFAVAALGSGQQPVNIAWALGSLLGINSLMLVIWLAGLLLAPGQLGSVMGRLWLWLSARLARDGRAAQLAPALMVLLERRRALRWAVGQQMHGAWTLAMLAALLTLLALLSTQRYAFVWQTTLLSGETFVILAHALGALPALLGFTVPTADMVRGSSDQALLMESARQAWASWLTGVTLIYGLLPRLLLALFCAWRWRRARTRLDIDLAQPGYALLRERLQPQSERLGISDAAPDTLFELEREPFAASSEGRLLVAVELDAQRPWPPALPEGVQSAGVLDDRAQRRHLLEQLSRYPAARLLIACDPQRSTDRGTLALLAELSRNAESTRVWLLPAVEGEWDPARVADWRAALARLDLAEADLAWLEESVDA